MFWAIWACLAKHKMLLKILKNYLFAKNRFHPSRFHFQFVENFGICSQKVNFILHVFEAIAKIFENHI